MTDKNCGNCVHFEGDDCLPDSTEDYLFGRCRRFPPCFATVNYYGDQSYGDPKQPADYWSFPIVHQTEYCGEHRQIEE